MDPPAASAIDRLAPTRRPEGPAAGYQRWRDLLFLHWPMPIDTVRALVPPQLSLDLWQGQALVGLVPFRMEGVRPWQVVPEVAAFAFPETNVRLYVHHRGRPGVYFLSLDAASWLAVKAARALWSLPYHHASMSCERSGELVRYRSRRASGASLMAACRAADPLPGAAPDSLEFFLLERYLLFVSRRGRILAGQVHHAPYPVRTVAVTELQQNLVVAAGLPAPVGAPTFAHFSDGVDVEIFALRSAD